MPSSSHARITRTAISPRLAMRIFSNMRASMLPARHTHPPGMVTDAPLRVFLCDDVAEFRVLMRYTLEEDPSLQVVGEAADGDRGVTGALDAAADVVLVDVSMPGAVDGFEAVRRLRAQAPSVGIV